MRKINIIFLFIILASNIFAIEIPNLSGRVNDYANLLSVDTINTIEQKLTQLEQKDSTQIVVLTIPSLKGVPIEDFAIAVFNAWGIGRAKIDNGVLLVIAHDDRAIRIEVGRGLEGKLTDVTSARIIRDDIKPSLTQGDFNFGITQGVNSIIKVTQGEYTQSKPTNKNYDNAWLVVVIIIYFALFKERFKDKGKGSIIYIILGYSLIMLTLYCLGDQNNFLGISLNSLMIFIGLVLFTFKASTKIGALINGTISYVFILLLCIYYVGEQNNLIDIMQNSFISLFMVYLLRFYCGISGGGSGGGGSFSGGGGISGGGGASGRF